MKELAAKGSIPGEELLAIIEIEAVGAIASLLENLSSTPTSAASGRCVEKISSRYSFQSLAERFEKSLLLPLNFDSTRR